MERKFASNRSCQGFYGNYGRISFVHGLLNRYLLWISFSNSRKDSFQFGGLIASIKVRKCYISK